MEAAVIQTAMNVFSKFINRENEDDVVDILLTSNIKNYQGYSMIVDEMEKIKANVPKESKFRNVYKRPDI